MPGFIKANLTGKIALRVQSSTDSRIILGEKAPSCCLVERISVTSDTQEQRCSNRALPLAVVDCLERA